MKLNNKGYMLVEVIVASAIALIMAYFLVDITITLTNKNNDYYVESTLITDKNLITKEIMDDVNNSDYSLIGISVNNDEDNITTATLNYKSINDNSTLERELIINKNTNEIKYGEYTKKLDDILTIRDFKIEKDENQKQLYISIPAYTNYSDVDYGINLIIPYTNDIEVIIPEANLCDLTSGTPNSPDLVEGLIPVVYDENKSSWVKADSTNVNSSWYNYCDKKWANAVLVTDTNRDSYKNANIGATILDSDILAFYVWIPRYKYKVWNINKQVGVCSYDAYHTGIDIIFENEKETTGTIRCNGYDYSDPLNYSDPIKKINESCTGSNDDYYTHPAFTFGNDELRGIWMGKFELSSSSSEDQYGGGLGTSLSVRILPNVPSWRENNLSNFFTVIYNMQKSDNVYGLSTSRIDTDSHMITNMEWGAVAYLTNSRYGRCTNENCAQVTPNNCSLFLTGIAADSESVTDESSSVCTSADNKYNETKGVLASTTGNITGVYDMAGGAPEFIMANTVCDEDVLGRYVFCTSNSGFSSNWYTSTASYSNSKYLTKYAPFDRNVVIQASLNRARLGDATSEVVTSLVYNGVETAVWYSSKGGEMLSFYEFSWLSRGAYSNYFPNSIFSSFVDTGLACSNSSRAVLVSLK